jgi:hypothetical protein
MLRIVQPAKFQFKLRGGNPKRTIAKVDKNELDIDSSKKKSRQIDWCCQNRPKRTISWSNQLLKMTA